MSWKNYMLKSQKHVLLGSTILPIYFLLKDRAVWSRVWSTWRTFHTVRVASHVYTTDPKRASGAFRQVIELLVDLIPNYILWSCDLLINQAHKALEHMEFFCVIHACIIFVIYTEFLQISSCSITPFQTQARNHIFCFVVFNILSYI